MFSALLAFYFLLLAGVLPRRVDEPGINGGLAVVVFVVFLIVALAF